MKTYVSKRTPLLKYLFIEMPCLMVGGFVAGCALIAAERLHDWFYSDEVE